MKSLTISFIAFIFFIACHEDPASTDSSRATLSTASGDTVIYYRQEPDLEYYNLPVCQGTYEASYVKCIDMDPVLQRFYSSSSSGTPATLTCSSQNDSTTVVVMISGIAYANQTVNFGQHAFVKPTYNATKKIPGGSKIDTPPSGISGVRQQGLALDTCTGVIDIDASIANGIFGLPPQKGSQRSFRIYYRLNDQSAFALNYTDVLFLFNQDNSVARTKAEATNGCTTVVVK